MKNLNFRLFVVIIMVIGGIFCLFSCSSDKRKVEGPVAEKDYMCRAIVTDSAGICYTAIVDTLFRVGDLIKINGRIVAINSMSK